MNQYVTQWEGPRASYRSQEGALGAALRLSASSSPAELVYVLEDGRGGYVVTQDDAQQDEALVAGRAVGAVIAYRQPSRKAKSNSTPPLPTAG